MLDAMVSYLTSIYSSDKKLDLLQNEQFFYTAAFFIRWDGFMSPILLIPKIIMQQLCRDGLGWDDTAPDELEQQWKTWLEQMPHLSSICIDRCFKPDGLRTPFTCELHYFSDASKTAYGAVCYLKVFDGDGNVKISFLMGKSWLTPLAPSRLALTQDFPCPVLFCRNSLRPFEVLF